MTPLLPQWLLRKQPLSSPRRVRFHETDGRRSPARPQYAQQRPLRPSPTGNNRMFTQSIRRDQQMSRENGNRRFYGQNNRQPIMTRPTPNTDPLCPKCGYRKHDNMTTFYVVQLLISIAWRVPELDILGGCVVRLAERTNDGFFRCNRSYNHCRTVYNDSNTINMRHDHNYILLKINGKAIRGLCDSGATMSVISADLAKRLQLKITKSQLANPFIPASGNPIILLVRYRLMLTYKD